MIRASAWSDFARFVEKTNQVESTKLAVGIAELFVPRFARQIYKILLYVETYQRDNKLSPLPILLCGYVCYNAYTFTYTFSKVSS